MYDKVKGLSPKYNTFDLSHDKKLTMEMGKMIPVAAIEALPGDAFTIETSHLTRFLPLATPVMHNVKVKMRYFFCPNRLVWPNWEDFITGPESSTDTTEPAHPYITIDSEPSDLADYMGVSTSDHGAGRTVEVNAIPFAAYQLIWNEYFRDQNHQTEIAYELSDGSNATGNLTKLEPINWMHDRFTSALPFTQKGPEVTLPSDVIAKDATEIYTNGFEQVIRSQTGTAFTADRYFGQRSSGNETGMSNGAPGSTMSNDAYLDLNGSHIINTKVNDLRQAFAIQKWLELNARAGNRYTEHIQAHFGVKPQDARLQRPEEFGGSVSDIQFSEVLQTSTNGTATGADTPLATMAGHGITASGSRKASYYAQEHGWVFAIAYVVPKSGYFQGVPAKFTKVDRYDYFQPLLAHIGEQPVKQKEIYAQGTTADDATFGYLPIYDEYRREISTVSGLMKSSLEEWHLNRKFASSPALNATFMRCEPSNRIFADTATGEQVIMHVHNSIQAKRKIPYYGTPLGV
jgi:hypothetical protein